MKCTAQKLGHNDPSQEYVATEHEKDSEVEFLKSTKKQKYKRLRKLHRLEKKRLKKKKKL
jgi:hypothetical protein